MNRWFEELPEQCPPPEAFNPDGKTLYRFLKNEEPIEEDLNSQRTMAPDKIFVGVDECIARSVSVLDNLEKCHNLRKLPRHKKKGWKAILELRLTESDGLILKTFSDPNHYSWWRSNSFNFATARVIK